LVVITRILCGTACAILIHLVIELVRIKG